MAASRILPAPANNTELRAKKCSDVLNIEAKDIRYSHWNVFFSLDDKVIKRRGLTALSDRVSRLRPPI